MTRKRRRESAHRKIQDAIHSGRLSVNLDTEEMTEIDRALSALQRIWSVDVIENLFDDDPRMCFVDPKGKIYSPEKFLTALKGY